MTGVRKTIWSHENFVAVTIQDDGATSLNQALELVSVHVCRLVYLPVSQECIPLQGVLPVYST